MNSSRFGAGLAIVVWLCATVPASSRQEAAPPRAAGPERPAAPVRAAANDTWGDWVEADFPFFSSVLDAGGAGSGLPPRNLTPRGLVLNLGRGYWAAFDTDLLRVAAVWRGTGVTPRALAPGSYHNPDRKTPGGQSPAPEPDGTVWLSNGIYPGWQVGPRPAFEDPREPAPTPEEVGRGPLPVSMGRFDAVRHVRNAVVLEYTAGAAAVREWMVVEGEGDHPSIVRYFSVGPSRELQWLVLGAKTPDVSVSLCEAPGAHASLESIPMAVVGGVSGDASPAGADVWVLRLAPRAEAVEFCVALTDGPARAAAPRNVPTEAPVQRWPQEVTSRITASQERAAYVVDHVALPVENPWRRNLRMGDIQFLADGTGVGVTLDGDVWMIRGLHEPAGTVRWRRFASGLHEPLTLAIRDEQIYVFDKNGIWRLRDTNGDGEADVHELFSNAFAQTADMREFPSNLRLAPGGEFVIAKGGQEATTLGKHNGSVLRISADGRHSTVLGYGFRQPQIGVNVRTGLVTSSDQQGHYIPTTPLHIVGDGQFYGFLSDKRPREVYPAPIAEPLTWIPHTVNASAMSQVWLFGARMGPLNDSMVHIGFNNPEVFRVIFNERGKRLQAAVVSVTRAFEFPPLNGSVNPADGQLYLAGFQILGWGTTAPQLAGFGRVRYTGEPSPLPREVVPMDKGVLLRFDLPIDQARAVDPASYSVTSWGYQRTFRYGSPQFRADGEPGVDRHAPSSAYLSQDGRSVFVAVPDMKPVMQMRITWSLAGRAGQSFEDSAYFTPYELATFDPRAEGFGELEIDLTPRTLLIDAGAPVSVEEGRRLYQVSGCVACHSIEQTSVARLGPSFHGLFGRPRTFANGVLRVVADEAYLRESILKPSARIVSGYEAGGAGMPSYAGVLTDAQVESLVLFIKSLE